MNWFNTIAILIVVYLAVFFQSTFNEIRLTLGVQIDLLPSLVVYAGLSSGIVTLTLAAVFGGLWFDSLSANPLGISVLPLFLIGLLFQRNRDLILREQPFAQFILGASASAAAPLCTVILLVNSNADPLVRWFSLWQLWRHLPRSADRDQGRLFRSSGCRRSWCSSSWDCGPRG